MTHEDDPPVKRWSFPAITDLRAARLRYGLTLAATTLQAGMSLTRASLIERNLDAARPGELEALRAAVADLSVDVLVKTFATMSGIAVVTGWTTAQTLEAIAKPLLLR
jgi:RNase P/RNase MRP subunit p30